METKSRIIIDQEELFSLLKWRDNNLDLVRQAFVPIFDKGTIIVGKLDFGTYLEFDHTDEEIIKIKSYIKKGLREVPLSRVSFKHIGNGKGYLIKKEISDAFYAMFSKKESENEMIQDVYTTVMSATAYLLFRNENFTVEEKKEIIRGPVKKIKGTYKPGAPKAVIVKNYKLFRTIDEKKLTKKEIKRVLEAWPVRGHWRQYKDGRRVFIKSYVKGDRRKEVSRDYIIKLKEEL